MKILTKSDDISITFLFSSDEILLLNNGFNEACNGFHIEEDKFKKTTGADKKEARILFDKINTLACESVKIKEKRIRGILTKFVKPKKHYSATLKLNQNELKIIVSIFDLVLEELESPEFETRTGFQRNEMIELSNQFRKLFIKKS